MSPCLPSMGGLLLQSFGNLVVPQTQRTGSLSARQMQHTSGTSTVAVSSLRMQAPVDKKVPVTVAVINKKTVCLSGSDSG